jgi:hypothetical protein
MLGTDDGIWSGNLNAADVLFLIAAIVFGLAAIFPYTSRRTEGVRFDFGVSLIPAGLCLLAVAWLLL